MDRSTPSTVPNRQIDPPALSRRRALAIAGALAGVLGVGWLADALAGLPWRGANAGARMLQAGTFDLAVTLSPAAPVAGVSASLTVGVHDLAGQRIAPARFRAVLLMPAMGMDPIEPVWEAITLGQYRASVVFAMAGAWSLAITLTDAHQQTTATEFDISVR